MMSRKDGFLALLVVVVWGLNFVVIKVGLHHMPPLLLAGLRFLLVAFPAIFFVARPKVPLTLLLGYGLWANDKLWAVRLSLLRDKVWYARRTGVVGITGAGLFYHGFGGVCF